LVFIELLYQILIIKTLLLWSYQSGLTTTVQVMPAVRAMSSGIWSIRMHTGTRWARRTQLKVGFTSATLALLALFPQQPELFIAAATLWITVYH
jgi:hypothetical protein